MVKARGVVGSGSISMDGAPILNQISGTLTGTIRPANITGTAPPGYPAVLYLRVFDALGNVSNIVSVPFTSKDVLLYSGAGTAERCRECSRG
jgi:hypothetical protein